MYEQNIIRDEYKFDMYVLKFSVESFFYKIPRQNLAENILVHLYVGSWKSKVHMYVYICVYVCMYVCMYVCKNDFCGANWTSFFSCNFGCNQFLAASSCQQTAKLWSRWMSIHCQKKSTSVLTHFSDLKKMLRTFDLFQERSHPPISDPIAWLKNCQISLT
jgi:hypothetical protein